MSSPRNSEEWEKSAAASREIDQKAGLVSRSSICQPSPKCLPPVGHDRHFLAFFDSELLGRRCHVGGHSRKGKGNKKRKRSDVLIGRDSLPRPNTSRFSVSETYPTKLLMRHHRYN